MPLYTLMSSLRWPRSYVGRILSLCFIGTHMPLIGLVLFELLSRDKEIVQTLGVVLVATIVGTAVTFFAVAQMLQPVLNATQALDRYTAEGTRPRLPLGFRDEAGRLMASVQRTLLQLDKKIGELSYTVSVR